MLSHFIPIYSILFHPSPNSIISSRSTSHTNISLLPHQALLQAPLNLRIHTIIHPYIYFLIFSAGPNTQEQTKIFPTREEGSYSCITCVALTDDFLYYGTEVSTHVGVVTWCTLCHTCESMRTISLSLSSYFSLVLLSFFLSFSLSLSPSLSHTHTHSHSSQSLYNFFSRLERLKFFSLANSCCLQVSTYSSIHLHACENVSSSILSTGVWSCYVMYVFVVECV